MSGPRFRKGSRSAGEPARSVKASGKSSSFGMAATPEAVPSALFGGMLRGRRRHPPRWEAALQRCRGDLVTNRSVSRVPLPRSARTGMGRHRAEHSGRCAGVKPSALEGGGSGCHRPTAKSVARGAPGASPPRWAHPERMSPVPKGRGALVKAWVEGTPREFDAWSWRHDRTVGNHGASRGDAKRAGETRVRSKASRSRKAASFGLWWTNDEEAGEPGDRPPASNGKELRRGREATRGGASERACASEVGPA